MTTARRIYRVVSWSLLALTLVLILLLLRKPSLPGVEASAQAAESFDQKLSQLNEAHLAGRPTEVRITEAELNSKLQQSLQSSPGPGGAATVKATTVHLEADRLRGTFTVNLKGKDVYLTLGGTLAVSNGTLVFTPTDVRMGSLPVPMALIEPTLRDRLNQMREHMKLPEYIGNVRVENGELVLEGQ